MLATYIPTQRENVDINAEKITEKPVIPPNDFTDLQNIAKTSHQLKGNYISLSWQLAKEAVKTSENPRTLMQLADTNMLRGLYQRSLQQYKKALIVDSNFLPIYPKLISLLLILGKPLEANLYYEALLNKTERRSQFLHDYIIFRLFFFPEKIDECVEDVQEVIKKDPKNYMAINTYGFILLNFKNQTENAENLFKKALKINNKAVFPLNNLGVCNFKRGNLKKAEELYRQALKIDVRFGSSYENLANIFLARGKRRNALEILTTAHHNNANLTFPWLHKIGILHYELGQLTLARDWFLGLLKQFPNSAVIFNDLGCAYMELREIEKAEECYKRSIAILNSDSNQKQFTHAIFNMGKVAMIKGDYGLLKLAGDNILSIDSNNILGFYLLSSAAMRIQEYTEAEKILNKVLKLDPNFNQAYIDLAFIYMSIKNSYSEAISLLEPVYEKAKNIPNLVNNLAFAYIKVKQLEKAKKILKSYIDGQDIPIVLLPTIGLLKIKEDKYEDGVSLYEEAIKKLEKDPLNQKMAKQTLAYEKASYWSQKNDIEKAKKYLKDAKKIGHTYLYSDIEILEDKLKKKVILLK